MTFYEQELKKLFGGSNVIRDAKYSGKTLLGRIDDELRVKLQFVYTETGDHYNALRLTPKPSNSAIFSVAILRIRTTRLRGKSTFGRTTGKPIGTDTVLLPQPIRRSPIP